MSSIAREFSRMLSRTLSLDANALQSPKPKSKPIHEVISFPRFKVTPDNDSCKNTSLVCEHMLSCGHIILTAGPNEPCAPNCHHVSARKGSRKGAKDEKHFYCDACVETDNEALIPGDVTSTKAEEMRLTMRQTEAKSRGKDTKYRRCYVSAIKSSVPCDRDGELRSRYVPRKNHHALDTAFPQVGSLIFQDIPAKPLEELQRAEQKKKSEAITTLSSSSDAGGSPANLGEFGESYLNYAQFLDEGEPEMEIVQPVRKKAVPGAAAKNPRARPAAVRSAEPVASSKRQKRPVVEEDSDEESVDRNDQEMTKRPAKRRKASISTASTPMTRSTKKAATPPTPTPRSGTKKKTATNTRKKLATITPETTNTRKKAVPVRRSPRSKCN